MAKIAEEIVIIKFSKLVKTQDQTAENIITDDIRAALEQVAQELAGQGVIVEAESAQ
jgi:hypothetical protein